MLLLSQCVNYMVTLVWFCMIFVQSIVVHDILIVSSNVLTVWVALGLCLPRGTSHSALITYTGTWELGASREGHHKLVKCQACKF